ncbi:hypothetical protein [Vibrio hibernica]|uniref:hypothetical protein n=1 Tax=Vibrio hibernica TaxID=2587465 RepID=UPI00187E4EAC|nr:hypothetical protein [Vibrio hibernica]
MNTQNVTAELHKVLSELNAEGKEPSVALVKARLSVSVPIPAIISTIKSWKASNRAPKIEIAAQKNASNNDPRVQSLETQMQTFIQRIEQLELRINQLEQKLTTEQGK